ncbi:MAG: hypothetical protein WA913_03865 [Pricia sp.]
MQSKLQKRAKQNYKNFGLALLAILGLMIFILIIGGIGYVGFFDVVEEGGGNESSAYYAGRAAGRTVRFFVNFYVRNGFFFGNLIALMASLERKNSFSRLILHGILGWGYVVFYALTRKTVPTRSAI